MFYSYQLQGIRAVIAESYERIHRSNLVGMGIVPLQYMESQSATSLGLTGKEKFNIEIPQDIKAGQQIPVKVSFKLGYKIMAFLSKFKAFLSFFFFFLKIVENLKCLEFSGIYEGL